MTWLQSVEEALDHLQALQGPLREGGHEEAADFFTDLSLLLAGANPGYTVGDFELEELTTQCLETFPLEELALALRELVDAVPTPRTAVQLNSTKTVAHALVTIVRAAQALASGLKLTSHGLPVH